MHDSTIHNNIVYTIPELKEKLTPLFESASIYKATLFGSYARGEATGASDIDIVIDSKARLKGFDFFGVVADIEDALSKPVDVYEAHYLPQNSRVLQAVSAEGVTIYER